MGGGGGGGETKYLEGEREGGGEKGVRYMGSRD